MATNILVPGYPNSNRTPGVFFGVSNANANTALANLKTLIIGQMISSGTATPNTPVLATNQASVNAMCGANSMIANMFATYQADDAFGEVWLLPVLDASGGTAGVFTVTFSGPATAAGTLSIYVNGTVCPVAVNSGDTATVMATNFVAALGLVPTLPLSATATAGAVTIMSIHKGLAASDIDIRLNYQGPIAGEVTPAGCGVAVVNTTPGTTDPTLTSGLASLTDSYAFIVNPYNASTQVNEVQAIQNDTTGSWSWQSNTGGGQFSAIKGTYSAIDTYGITNNLQHLSVIGFTNTPSPVYSIASDYAAVCANSLRVDPALPLTQIQLTQVLAPPTASQYTRLMRNTLLYDGISSWVANSAGQIELELAITTYQTAPSGAPDNSYLYVNTLYSIQGWITQAKSTLQTKFARYKLVDNNTPVQPGTNTVNPNAVLAEVIAIYQASTDAGLTQDVGAFIKGAAVQMVGTNQVNVLAPIQLATGLYQIAVAVDFLL